MDFKFSEEQLMTRTMVREFAQKEVKPLSVELDAKTNPIDCLSWELVEKASKLGMRTLAIPEALGGIGADLITRMLVQEELGAADLGFADLLRTHGGGMLRLNEEQMKEFLPQYLEDHRHLEATCRTEPDHGTDNLLQQEAPEASIQTFAEKKGDEYIINGRKQFISNGGIAKLYFVHARTDRHLPITQCESCFLVPADTPGLSIGKIHNKLGRRLLINGEVILEDVRVPARHLVGEPGKAGVMGRMMYTVIGLLSHATVVGFLRTCYEETLIYAGIRVQGGKPIIQHSNVAQRLAEMKVKIEAARLLTLKSAWSRQTNFEFDPNSWLLIKGFLNDITVSIISMMVEIFGGAGTDKDMPIEKYIRDAYTSLHAYGSRDVAYIWGAPKLEA